jgi:hypothetical protein
MKIYHVANVREQECVILQNAIGVLPEEGLDSSGRTVVHIDFPIPNPAEWVETHYWDGTEWQTRESRPNDYCTWDAETSSWSWSAEDLLTDIRLIRDKHLRLSDWTRLDDTGLSEESKSEWAVYRQGLRDITENLDNVRSLDEVFWPTRPE